jgi:hypothetical protein
VGENTIDSTALQITALIAPHPVKKLLRPKSSLSNPLISREALLFVGDGWKSLSGPEFSLQFARRRV